LQDLENQILQHICLCNEEPKILETQFSSYFLVISDRNKTQNNLEFGHTIISTRRDQRMQRLPDE